MALWQKVKKLNSNAIGEITSIYSSHNIPIEVRDFCAVWIEASIKHLKPETFISGLKLQVQERLLSLNDSSTNSNSFIPFYVTNKLSEFENILTTLIQSDNESLRSQELQKRFVSCMESERMVVKREEQRSSMQQPSQVSLITGTSLSPFNPQPSPPINVPFQTTSSMASSTSFQALNASISTTSHVPEAHVQPSEYYSPTQFLNNSVRIVIDREMDKIFEAVWGLEAANNDFTFKCHELKRNQDLRNQQLSLVQINGTQQSYRSAEFQELEAKVGGIRNEILEMATLIYGKTCEVRSRTNTVLQNWTQLKSELDKDLGLWTQEQRLYANGKNMSMNLEKMQHLSEYLMEVAWKLRHLLQTTGKIRSTNMSIIGSSSNVNINTTPDIPQQLDTVTQLIKDIVQDTFVVINQPTQVLRTNTRFHVPPGKNDMEVALLVGDKLSLQVTPPSVCVAIIEKDTCAEIEANGLEGEKFIKVARKGKLLPDNVRLAFCPETKRSSAIFRQISLKDFYRNGRKSTMGKEQSECVTEDKLCLLFRTEFTVGDLDFQIWRTSLPIVITTHVSQDCLAWAVITWDNAFAQPARIPFHVPDYANWASISGMLNYKFESMVGASLSPENLNYLADRLSTYPNFPDRLSWVELCKMDMPEREFTFWEWFWEAAKLIEQHFKDAWKDGHIMGFVDKEKAKSLVCNSGCSPGTFLFRLSDTYLGGISIVWLHSDGKSYCVSPFTGKDLSFQPLAERLDQETLYYVYPNVPKNEAFKKCFDEYNSTSKTKSSDGYVRLRNQLVIDNPNIPRFCLMDKRTKSTSDNYQIITGQQSLCSSSDQNPGQTKLTENVIEIDIDKIVDSLSSPEYWDYMASPDTTTSYCYQPSPSGSVCTAKTSFSGDAEVMQAGTSDWSYSEESFYTHL